MEKFKDMMTHAKTLPSFSTIHSGVIDIISDYFDYLEKIDKDGYNMIMDEIYACVYGPHFNKELAVQAVAGMRNVDGTTGEHWSIEQTTEAAKQSGIVFKTYNEYDFYYVLNMLHSDYFNIFRDDSNAYIQLAVAWLGDPDVPEGKAWRYYNKVVKMC